MKWLKNSQQKKDGGKESELQEGVFIEKWWETKKDVLGNLSDHFSNIEKKLVTREIPYLFSHTSIFTVVPVFTLKTGEIHE